MTVTARTCLSNTATGEAVSRSWDPKRSEETARVATEECYGRQVECRTSSVSSISSNSNQIRPETMTVVVRFFFWNRVDRFRRIPRIESGDRAQAYSLDRELSAEKSVEVNIRD
jgi:hypothetical protein